MSPSKNSLYAVDEPMYRRSKDFRLPQENAHSSLGGPALALPPGPEEPVIHLRQKIYQSNLSVIKESSICQARLNLDFLTFKRGEAFKNPFLRRANG
jgi:hypothetical protein